MNTRPTGLNLCKLDSSSTCVPPSRRQLLGMREKCQRRRLFRLAVLVLQLPAAILRYMEVVLLLHLAVISFFPAVSPMPF